MSDTATLMAYFGMFCGLCGYVLGCFVSARATRQEGA